MNDDHHHNGLLVTVGHFFVKAADAGNKAVA
jgi:hypothetical protein